MLILVLIDVIYHDLSIFTWNIGHDEVLFKRCWQDRISAIINMLADDVDTTWCAAIESWLDTIKSREAAGEILIAGLVLLID